MELETVVQQAYKVREITDVPLIDKVCLHMTNHSLSCIHNQTILVVDP